jgi:hypothetical protein
LQKYSINPIIFSENEYFHSLIYTKWKKETPLSWRTVEDFFLCVYNSTISFNESEEVAAEAVCAIHGENMNPVMKQMWKNRLKKVKEVNIKYTPIRKKMRRIKLRDSAMYKLSKYNRQANLKRDQLNVERKKNNEKKRSGFIVVEKKIELPEALSDESYAQINPTALCKKISEEKKNLKTEKRKKKKVEKEDTKKKIGKGENRFNA